jgi:glycosyltransferase involved in cell wall biosynthesis
MPRPCCWWCETMMTVSPLVSIVTPTYNAAATIAACCDSVAGQDYAPIEHIVVDAASTDGTVAALKSRGVRYESAPDAGIFDGMSKGVRLASGEFVHILNADDHYAHPSVLSKVVAAMTEQGWDLCHARAAQITASGRLVRVVGRDVDKRHLLRKMRVAHPTVVLRRSVYQQYGAFSIGFRVSADYEFLLRIWDRVRVGFIDEVLVHMLIGGNSNRPENLVPAYRESLAAAVIHGAHPAPAALRCSYEIAKHRLFFARVYRQS